MNIKTNKSENIINELTKLEDRLVELHIAYEADVEMIERVKVMEALTFNETRVIDDLYLVELYKQYSTQYNAVKFDILKQIVYVKEELLKIQEDDE